MNDRNSFSIKEYAILDPPIKFGVLRTPRIFSLGTLHLPGKAGLCTALKNLEDTENLSKSHQTLLHIH